MNYYLIEQNQITLQTESIKEFIQKFIQKEIINIVNNLDCEEKKITKETINKLIDYTPYNSDIDIQFNDILCILSYWEGQYNQYDLSIQIK